MVKCYTIEGDEIDIDIEIRESSIPGAGKGAFANQDIPEGYYSFYEGVIKGKNELCNDLYTWEIHKFSIKTGKMISDKVIYNIDSGKTGNWTRYVNCGMTKADNNIKPLESFGNLLYIFKRDIKKGEELFVDYGRDYRRNEFGLSYKKT